MWLNQNVCVFSVWCSSAVDQFTQKQKCAIDICIERTAQVMSLNNVTMCLSHCSDVSSRCPPTDGSERQLQVYLFINARSTRHLLNQAHLMGLLVPFLLMQLLSK